MSSVKKKKTSITSRRIMRVSRDIVYACRLWAAGDGARVSGQRPEKRVKDQGDRNHVSGPLSFQGDASYLIR